MGLGEKDSHIQLPIVLEPGTANYWKIVKGTYQGERGSVFEIVSDEIESSLVDEDDPSLIYDKLYIDIYGMGLWDQGFSALRKKDLLRIFFAMVHGAYNDVVQPMLNVAAGWKDLKESSGSDDYRYDFRYGKRKWPELALCSKLLYDLAYTGELARMTADAYTGTKSVWDYVKQMAVFAYNRILTCPSDDPNDDKRTYTNLIYNIYKKYSRTSSTSKEFRDNFKAVANNLTHMKKISFAGKVIKFGETAVDLAGGVDAILRSSMKQTFIIDRFDEPTIQIIAPADVYKKMPESVHLEWETFKGDRFGDFVYDLTLFVEDAEKGVYVNIFNNYHDTQYDLNLNRIPEAKNAGRIRYQIVAHHPEYPEVIYSKTDFLSLLDISLDYDIKFIDLGLPSGTLWADRNLGAKAVEDYGNYYAWGETTGFDEGKSTFSWLNYKYCHGSANTLTKYCSKSSYGYRNFTDVLTELEATDDAASTAYVSRSYHIPTKEDWEELIRLCNWRWFTWGMMVYGPNGNIITLHNAGYRHGMTLLESDSEGHYWSSTLDVNSPDDAWYLYFSGRSYEKYDYYRSEGRSIRPVYRDGMIAAPKRVPEATQAIESLEKHPQEGVVIKMVSSSK